MLLLRWRDQAIEPVVTWRLGWGWLDTGLLYVRLKKESMVEWGITSYVIMPPIRLYKLSRLLPSNQTLADCRRFSSHRQTWLHRRVVSWRAVWTQCGLIMGFYSFLGRVAHNYGGCGWWYRSICAFVDLSVNNEHVLWKNGWLDRDTVWNSGSGGSKEACVTWGPDPALEWANFGGEMVRRNVSYRENAA